MLNPDPRPPNRDIKPSPMRQGTGADIDWDEARNFAYAKALRICRDQHLADDVAQESALRLLRYAKPIRDWQAFLSTIAFNVSQTFLKRRKRIQTRVASESPIVECATDSDPKPVDRLMLKNLVAELDERFGRGTRAIVDFRKQNFSWEEIAAIVQLCDRTCRERYKKALTWISEQLTPCAKEATDE